MELWSELDEHSRGYPIGKSLGKAFADILSGDVISRQVVEVPESCLSPAYYETDDYIPDPFHYMDHERFFSMEHLNRRVRVTKHSTNAHRFLSELSDIDVYRHNIPLQPFGHVGVLENGPELKAATRKLKQEALGNLKFSLLAKSYKLTTQLVEKVVNRHAEQLAKELRGIYPDKIRETTTNLLFSIICDTHEDNSMLMKDIEQAENKFHENNFTNRGESSSQLEHDLSKHEKVEQFTFGNMFCHNVDEAMENFYCHFQTIESRKALKEFMSDNFLGDDDLTICKTILKESTKDHDNDINRKLMIYGFIKNVRTPPEQSRKRTLLFLLGRKRRYRNMKLDLEVFYETGDIRDCSEEDHAEGYYGIESWRFIMKIQLCHGNNPKDDSSFTSIINIFYTRRKKLKK